MSLTASPGHDVQLAPEVERRCRAVLNLLLPYRRGSEPDGTVLPVESFGPQIRQIARFVGCDDPILFTLPAFPCKSPNPAKVIGPLPDEAERRALRFLDQLCRRVEEVYPPGARMLICSDGHVFADQIGVGDDQVDAYAERIDRSVVSEGLDSISLFDLRQVFGELAPADRRAVLENRYAISTDHLRAEVRRSPDTDRLYRGITRFLVEDSGGFTGSRSALQRDCRRRAYQVIRRSRAWGTLIGERYPRSVRLSIHPQPAGVDKFGIRLLEAADGWTTPWHATLLVGADGVGRLVRHDRAARLGVLVRVDGEPSHYVQPTDGTATST